MKTREYLDTAAKIVTTVTNIKIMKTLQIYGVRI